MRTLLGTGPRFEVLRGGRLDFSAWFGFGIAILRAAAIGAVEVLLRFGVCGGVMCAFSRSFALHVFCGAALRCTLCLPLIGYN
jgi:hypothetical protein